MTRTGKGTGKGQVRGQVRQVWLGCEGSFPSEDPGLEGKKDLGTRSSMAEEEL